MKLSDHFQLSEFEVTSTGIPNEVHNIFIAINLSNLCENLLEHIRKFFGHPIYINSGYRCARVNTAVGGVPTSDHLYGCAADISAGNLDYELLEDAVKAYIDTISISADKDKFNQIIFYPKRKFIHVSLRPIGHIGRNKMQILTK
ncbi:peptidase [Dipodfec virus RodF1_17]|uniref:Peptidase n=1 Tax=Dipodfec virus RodF1_17 TaxID=2929293 RepID=A0A976R5K9_9VIRU|nr:peptidase [Dipodfec virus RodF1_17]